MFIFFHQSRLTQCISAVLQLWPALSGQNTWHFFFTSSSCCDSGLNHFLIGISLPLAAWTSWTETTLLRGFQTSCFYPHRVWLLCSHLPKRTVSSLMKGWPAKWSKVDEWPAPSNYKQEWGRTACCHVSCSRWVLTVLKRYLQLRNEMTSSGPAGRLLDDLDNLALLSHTQQQMQEKSFRWRVSSWQHRQRATNLTTNIKIRIFNTTVNPVLLYRAETWRTTTVTMKIIQTFINICLRRILQLCWDLKWDSSL